MKRLFSLPLWFAAVFTIACSHAPKKVNYSATTSPTEVAEQLTADIQAGYANQHDVLAGDDFLNGQKKFDRAKEQMRDGAKNEKILSTLGQARAYLDRSREIAEGRKAMVEGVLNARKMALDAGARNFPPQRARLSSIDEDMRDVVGEKRIGPEKFSKLQSDYMDLELAAIQSTHLNTARSRVEGSKQKNAAKNTPRVLNRAEIDLRNAENVIAANRHNEQAFHEAVAKANASSDFLVAVSQKVRAGSATLPESVAIRLVQQERSLTGLNEQLKMVESQREKGDEIMSLQDQELKKARETQALERALASARKEFTREEADVYRDGDKLLIRLKSMQFASGRSDLPQAALAVLGKVRVVTEDLNPSQVVIEGHTDSTGSERENLSLSQKRAEAVAEFLTTSGLDSDKVTAVGYGFKKPLGSNKSKVGRAQNRRVDVILTPGTVATSQTSM